MKAEHLSFDHWRAKDDEFLSRLERLDKCSARPHCLAQPQVARRQKVPNQAFYTSFSATPFQYQVAWDSAETCEIVIRRWMIVRNKTQLTDHNHLCLLVIERAGEGFSDWLLTEVNS